MKSDILTNLDFENISWHDSRLLSINFPLENQTLRLDLVFVSIDEEDENWSLHFTEKPAVLSFENTIDLSIHFDMEDYAEIFIEEIERTNERLIPNKTVHIYDFVIHLTCGEIRFSSTGFKQYLQADELK